MEIFVIIGLLICVIICLIAVFKTKNPSHEWSKSKEYTPRSDMSDEDTEGTPSLIESIFRKHYSSALKMTKSSSMTNNAEFELLPAMYTICDCAAYCSGKDRIKINNIISETILKIYPNSPEFNKRFDLYESMLNDKKPVCFWYHGDKSVFYQNPVSICVALLCDILYNPSCAEDYENAPLMLNDIFSDMTFFEDVVLKLSEEFTKLFKDICEL